jgi:hypothetical protein
MSDIEDGFHALATKVHHFGFHFRTKISLVMDIKAPASRYLEKKQRIVAAPSDAKLIARVLRALFVKLV